MYSLVRNSLVDLENNRFFLAKRLKQTKILQAIQVLCPLKKKKKKKKKKRKKKKEKKNKERVWGQTSKSFSRQTIFITNKTLVI